MPAPTKAESARLNGAKSQGPITPQGKMRSSLNAVRHGILSRSLCLTIEEPADYRQLLQDFLDRFQPADNVELRLVEQMANCAFRLERLPAAETALFDFEMERQAKDLANRFDNIDDATRLALAFKSLADNSTSLPLYLRYETTLTRQHDRALKQLLILRAKVPVPPQPELPNEPTTEVTSVESQVPATEPNSPDVPIDAQPPQPPTEPTTAAPSPALAPPEPALV